MEELAAFYRQRGLSPARHSVLFTHFLPQGYKVTTLGQVDEASYSHVLLAKMHLGMIITLYDDFADHPLFYNPPLLSRLYQLNVGKKLKGQTQGRERFTSQEQQTLDLAADLYAGLENHLQPLPHYRKLKSLLSFDIQYFYLCNRYAELVTEFPTLRNLTESRILGHHNMGMVAAGMIDLMGLPDFQWPELGRIREIFLLGQRLGRIGNVVATYDREMSEGDATNEIMIAGHSSTYRASLEEEFFQGIEKINELGKDIKSFAVSDYSRGLLRLYHLHLNLREHL